MPFSPELLHDATQLLERLRKLGIRIATAESCTGGLIAAVLTEIPGSSDVVDRGFVTYSNEAKIELLGVPDGLISGFGAVSPEVAIAMAEGALREARATVAVAVTGVAGPGGGTADKPVGLVHLAAAHSGKLTVHEECRFGDRSRADIRMLTVAQAFRLVRGCL